MNTKRATADNVSGADPYPLLSRPIQRTNTGLRIPKQDTNHGSINPRDDEASPSRRRYATNPPHGQVSMRAFADDRGHHSFDWDPVTFASSGSISMPFKTLVTGSSEDASRPRATQPVPRLDVPGTTASSSLYQLLAEATLDEIPTAPHTNVNHSPFPSSRSPPAHELKLNPFRSPLHSTIMFPPLNTVFNDLHDDRASPQIELDGLGCALLPASEYVLALESECNFHYEFWDGYNEAQHCFPVNIALHLDPARAPLYEYYPLAMPSVPKIAVRLTSLALPTRFTRLLPIPRPPVSETDDDIPEDDPNDPEARYAYTTSYCGCILEPPRQLQAAVAGKEVKHDATGKRDKPGATGKGDKPARKKDEPEVVPAKGIRLASNWQRIKPLGGLSVSSSGSGSGSEDKEDSDSSETEPEKTRGAASERDNDRRGFLLRASIPVPLSLFEHKETCMFRVDARVWIENPYTYVRGENGRARMSRRRWYRADMGRGGGKWEMGDFSEPEDQSGVLRMVETSRTVTVSHLQSGREMI